MPEIVYHMGANRDQQVAAIRLVKYEPRRHVIQILEIRCYLPILPCKLGEGDESVGDCDPDHPVERS